MAIKKTLISAKPYSQDGKVTRWTLIMRYEQGTEGKDDYYTNEKQTTVDAVEEVKGKDVSNFTPKAEGDWTKKELEDLCPTARWDEVFASQYDSVITNPVVSPVANHEFVIPN